MGVEERVAELETAFVTLTKLAVSSSERMDTHGSWINALGNRMEELAAAQTNSETKIAALTDAQIKTEEALTALTVRVDRLSEIVERFITEGRNGNS